MKAWAKIVILVLLASILVCVCVCLLVCLYFMLFVSRVWHEIIISKPFLIWAISGFPIWLFGMVITHNATKTLNTGQTFTHRLSCPHCVVPTCIRWLPLVSWLDEQTEIEITLPPAVPSSLAQPMDAASVILSACIHKQSQAVFWLQNTVFQKYCCSVTQKCHGCDGICYKAWVFCRWVSGITVNWLYTDQCQ